MENKNRNFKKLKRMAADIRIETIKAMAYLGFGHIGGSMSIADVLAVLYGNVLNIDPSNPLWEDRDWLVLSKGHCGPALYATLAIRGYFPIDELRTLNKPKTRLPSHCDRLKTPGIDMSTGSLGQGISTGMGIALGNRMKGKDSYTYIIVGDGELQEGQVWEGVQFAAHQNLDNIIVFVDDNKKQLDGWTKDICKSYNLETKFESFGWHSQKVKGDDVEEIFNSIMKAKLEKGKPSVIILDTVKGFGCNFAENADFNHYMSITQTMADDAIEEIEKNLNC